MNNNNINNNNPAQDAQFIDETESSFDEDPNKEMSL